MSAEAPGRIAEDLFRRESARLVATLTAHLGVHRLQLAEDVVQEALVRAMQVWPYRGVPDNPAAWLTQTAKNLALDQLRREQRWQEKEAGIGDAHERWLAAPATAEPVEVGLADDTLRLMFVCFHPQLSSEAQIALALRTLGGLSPAEIAAAFLTSEAAIAKRLVRARQRIRELNLPFAVPEAHELPARLDGVLTTLYLIFNEGYKASGGERLVRDELCHEAIRLTTLLAEIPVTNQPRTHALLALMLLNAARLSARLDETGNILRLHEQNRAAWDGAMIARGIQHLGRAASGDEVSQFHLEAGIAACHSLAASDATTDWPRILSFYDELVRVKPTSVVGMNRAVAIARVHGARAGLEALERVRGLESHYLLHAVRGALTEELGERAVAAGHYRRAAALALLPTEKEFLARRAEAVTDS